MRTPILTSFVLLCLIAGDASAIVTEVAVTPEFIRAHMNEITVVVSRQPNGLLRYRITRELGKKERYLVMTCKVRSGGRLVAEFNRPSFAWGGKETLFVDLVPEYVAGSQIEVAERAVTKTDSQPVPLPDGKDYLIRTSDFVPAVH